MTRFLRALGFLFLVLFADVSESAPSVSGVSGMVSNGSAITVSGTGFGTTGPTILVFDDFEKGTNGSAITTGAGSTQVGQWDEISGSGLLPRYSNSYSRGTLSMRSDWSDNGAAEGGRWVGRRPISANGGIYVSWWAYLPVGRDVPGTNTPWGANWKTWWLFKYDSSIHGFQGSDYGHEFLTNSLPTSSAWYAGPINDLTTPARLSGTWGDAIGFNRGQWWRWEQYMKEATDSSGILQFWQTSPTRTRQQIVNLSGKPTEHAGEVWDTFRFPGYGRGDTNSQTYYDDIYVATGPGALARVEIGNASTYSASTNLAVATATSWSDTSVQATVRLGNFSNGAAYLYVIDSAGAVNATGYPITVGGEGSSYTVTPSAGANGSISPNTPQTVSSGATTQFTVTPNAGYTTSVGGTCGGNLVGTTYTTSAITADCTVAATFPCKKLATPSGLSFVGLVANPPSNATLSFDWSDVTTHADGSALTGDLANYRTYFGTVSGGPYNTASSASSQISVGPTNANVTYYARVAAESSVNSICNSDQTAEISLFADTVPPVLSGLNPSGNYPKTAANVALGVTTNEAATCRHGSAGSAWSSKTAFSTTGATSHSATLAVWAGLVKRICYQCRDALLNESAESCTTFSVSAKQKAGGFN